ncbi:hypothetical protein [Actinokineospora xionganensis]|uniref:Uncharacterized protein n=1 Tax=Actinokineospora xionganensis TaxID=2684470 RepID=A0ABR7LFK1_9PSEU|nr:hypothetical protein [Actinokineospora xionganensis]MBC6451368.1 hypothetical protein [Actinokineospora xionganensis]
MNVNDVGAAVTSAHTDPACTRSLRGPNTPGSTQIHVFSPTITDERPSRRRTSGECRATGAGIVNREYASCASCPGVGNAAATGTAPPEGSALAQPNATPSHTR